MMGLSILQTLVSVITHRFDQSLFYFLQAREETDIKALQISKQIREGGSKIKTGKVNVNCALVRDGYVMINSWYSSSGLLFLAVHR
jgi:hypothetical protein